MRVLTKTNWHDNRLKPPSLLASIDWGHQLSVGLAGVWLAPDQAGTSPLGMVEMISGAVPTPTGTFATVMSPYGPAVDWGSSSYLDYGQKGPLWRWLGNSGGVPSSGGGHGVTAFAIVNVANHSAFRPVFTTGGGGSNYNGFVIGSASDAFYAWFGDNSGTSNSNRAGVYTPGPGPLATGVWKAVGASMRANGDGSIYWDGVSQSVSFFGSATLIAWASGASARIGTADTGGAFLGDIACVYYWNRDLSDAEHLSLAQDPFQFFRLGGLPLTDTGSTVQTTDVPYITAGTALYTPAVTGGAVNLSVPYIAPTTTLYTPTETQFANVPYIAPTTTLYTPTLIDGRETLKSVVGGVSF